MGDDDVTIARRVVCESVDVKAHDFFQKSLSRKIYAEDEDGAAATQQTSRAQIIGLLGRVRSDFRAPKLHFRRSRQRGEKGTAAVEHESETNTLMPGAVYINPSFIDHTTPKGYVCPAPRPLRCRLT